MPRSLEKLKAGGLDVPLLLFRGHDLHNALFAQAVAQHHAGGEVGQGHARGLAEERHRARGPGVNLDHIHVVLAVHDELDVVQAHDANAQAQPHRVVDDGLTRLLAHREGGIRR